MRIADVVLRACPRQVYHFFERNKIVSGVVGLCSIFCMEFLFFLSSHIFNLKALSLNWPTGLENRIGALGVLTTICEDLPQLALQIYVSTQVGMSTVLLLSLVASGTALLVSLLRRIVLVVISRHQTRHTGFLSPDDKAFGLENSGKTITNELATLPRRPEPHRSVVVLTE